MQKARSVAGFAWREDFAAPLRGSRGKASSSGLVSALSPLRASPPPRATSGECRTSLTSSLRHAKSPLCGGLCVAQRRGFEPPDESPPSHDFQSCSLNHSDISARRKLFYNNFAKNATSFYTLSPFFRLRNEKIFLSMYFPVPVHKSTTSFLLVRSL